MKFRISSQYAHLNTLYNLPHLHIPRLGHIHYHEYGSGSKLMFAFHGYGMTGRQFDVLENSVMKEYRIIGFDHFFHGDSKLHTEEEQAILSGMEKPDVRLYIDAWFEAFGRQRFSVMGYSIGANFALSLIEFFAAEIDSLVLMAPDGLAVHRGFHFLRRHFIGKKLFRSLTYGKNLATGGLNTLRRFRLLDEALHKIAYNEVDTPQKRLDVYYTLNFIRHISPDIEAIVLLINQHHIQTTLVFGQFDTLFPRSSGVNFVSAINHAEVLEVPMGHWLVTKELDNILSRKKQGSKKG